MPGTNTLAYYEHLPITDAKSLLRLTPGHDVTVELHHDPADRLVVNLNVHVDQRSDLGLNLVAQEREEVGGHRLTTQRVCSAASDLKETLNVRQGRKGLQRKNTLAYLISLSVLGK